MTHVGQASPYPKPGDPPLSPPTLGTSNDGWETRRMPDAVRAAALANAVDLARGRMEYGHVESTDSVIAMARDFEAYLTDEGAND